MLFCRAGSEITYKSPRTSFVETSDCSIGSVPTLGF
jgi:hypothetical protein